MCPTDVHLTYACGCAVLLSLPHSRPPLSARLAPYSLFPLTPYCVGGAARVLPIRSNADDISGACVDIAVCSPPAQVVQFKCSQNRQLSAIPCADQHKPDTRTLLI